MTDEPNPLDDRLRQGGAALRDGADGWRPDAADVAARSARQSTSARRTLGGAIAIAVVLLVGIGVVATRSGEAADDDLRVASMGTELSGTSTSRSSVQVSPLPDPPVPPAPSTGEPPAPPVDPPTSVPTTQRTVPADRSTTGDEPDEPTTTETSAVPPTTVAAPTTTVPGPPVPPGVELRDDGLGIVTLGQDGDRAATALYAAFGAARLDTGWRLDPDVGPVRTIIWGPPSANPNAGIALSVRLIRLTDPAAQPQGLVSYAYCPVTGFPHLLLPGGGEPGPACFSRSIA